MTPTSVATEAAAQTALIEQVRQWADQYEEGEEGFCAPENARWEQHAHFPLRLLGDRAAWSEWFDGECRMWAEDGDPDRFADMNDGVIHVPVVVLMRRGTAYVWDGNHRIGAAMRAGAATVPAIIGYPLDNAPRTNPCRPK